MASLYHRKVLRGQNEIRGGRVCKYGYERSNWAFSMQVQNSLANSHGTYFLIINHFKRRETDVEPISAVRNKKPSIVGQTFPTAVSKPRTVETYELRFPALETLCYSEYTYNETGAVAGTGNHRRNVENSVGALIKTEY